MKIDKVLKRQAHIFLNTKMILSTIFWVLINVACLLAIKHTLLGYTVGVIITFTIIKKLFFQFWATCVLKDTFEHMYTIKLDDEKNDK